MSSAAEPKPVNMVSSTVYTIENLLDQVFATLNGFGYDVWMSHAGTVPVDPQKSNFQNCLDAVENCDVFPGLIAPFYGSGRDAGQASITLQELLQAVSLGKLRWLSTHDHVQFTRLLLRQYRFHNDGTPNDGFTFKPTKVMNDIRVIDMYEAATQEDIRLADRRGHWVHRYYRDVDVLQFISNQFGNVERIKGLIAQWRAS